MKKYGWYIEDGFFLERIIKCYGWYTEDGFFCMDEFDSPEEAIEDATERWNNGNEPYEDGQKYAIRHIKVGEIVNFNLKEELEGLPDEIVNLLDAALDYFSSSLSNCEQGCIIYKDADKFNEEIIDAVIPIIEKYLSLHPTVKIVNSRSYDMVEKRWENG